MTPAASDSAEVRVTAGRVWQIARANPHWCLLLLVYSLAWYTPLSWLWRLLHPGQPVPDGMDGPVSWNWRWWLQASSPLSFQLLVPVGVLLLALRRRTQLDDRWRQLRQRSLRPGERLLARLCLGAGCGILLLSHLVHVITLAVLGLQLIGVGAVALIYGTQILRALTVPFLFWLIMTMPPESVPAKVEEKMMVLSARGAASLLRLQKRPALAEGWTLVEGGTSISLSPASSGGALVSATLAFVLWQSLYTGRRRSQILLRLGVGALVALSLNFARVTLIGRIHPGSSDLADRLNSLNPWFLVPVSLGLTFGILAALGRFRPAALAQPIRALSRTTEKPLDQMLESSGSVISRAGGGLAPLGAPFRLMAHGLEWLIVAPFKLMTRSAQQIENRLKRWERARRKQKRGRR